MDKSDVEIIRELSQSQDMMPARVGLRSSYREMARKIGISPGTVRNRVGKMYASGVLGGSSVYPNPTLFGLKGGAFAVDVSPRLAKSEVLSNLKSTAGIVFIHNFRGSLVGLLFVYQPRSLEETIEGFKATAGAEDALFSRVEFPPCKLDLDDFDLHLILDLSRGFHSYAQLSRNLDTSVRTIKRRLSRLKAEGAILSAPTLDYKAISGGAAADLIVVYQDSKDETEKKILAIIGQYMIFAGVGEDYVVYNLVLPNVSMATELASAAAVIDGVSFARAELVEEHIDLTGGFASLLERKIKFSKNKGQSNPIAQPI